MRKSNSGVLNAIPLLLVREAGLSRGLKNMPPAYFSRLRRRPVQAPPQKYEYQNRGTPKGVPLFWCARRDLNPHVRNAH